MTQRRFLVSGAGSGIGMAIALEFSRRGDAVVLLGRRQEKLEACLNQLTGDGHQIIVADIADRPSLQKAFDNCPPLQGAIANAGVGGENDFDKEDRWAEIINTNLSGSYYFSRLAYNKLKEISGYKHMIYVSSILARLGVPGYSAYCASKTGLLGLMRSQAAEWTQDKILVNAICPGWVDTSMAREGIQNFAELTKKSYDDALAEQMSYVPLGKMSTPAEIAKFVAYLTSAGQTSITGQSLDINNGALMPS